MTDTTSTLIPPGYPPFDETGLVGLTAYAILRAAETESPALLAGAELVGRSVFRFLLGDATINPIGYGCGDLVPLCAALLGHCPDCYQMACASDCPRYTLGTP